jgi:SAM-dependent methyltransferase
MNIQQLFELGMKREVPQLLDFPKGLVLNLGAGKHVLPGALNLDYPQWDAENYHIEVTDRIRWAHNNPNRAYPLPPEAGDMYVTCPDGIVAGIHAYHFLEHVRDPRRMLREMQRVLMPGGVINICVPHYWGSMAHHDLDHKNTYAIDTWANTFSAPWYTKDREGWKLRIHFNMLMAVTERNAAILTQLVKE